MSLRRCVLALALLVAIAAAWFSASVQAQQSRLVTQGVYTDEQAKRGQAIYKEDCASCHGDTLGGRLGPPLTGSDFLGVWNKEPLSELFIKIRNTMPQNAPGKRWLHNF